ncbi:MAG: hypothetical protein WCT31_02475 [Candidatus Micrarchaeia archaeon]|jgi:archaellum biogenesis ATPase FlaH
MDGDETISPDKSILLVAKVPTYMLEVVKVVRSLKDSNVCFISTNKGYDSLAEVFKMSDVDTSKVFYIDCVTLSVVKVQDSDNCKYISSPAALTELDIMISKRMKAGDAVFVVDSLSTFMVYQSEERIMRFVHNLIGNCKTNKKALILLMSEGDMKSDLYNKVSLMVDEVQL